MGLINKGSGGPFFGKLLTEIFSKKRHNDPTQNIAGQHQAGMLAEDIKNVLNKCEGTTMRIQNQERSLKDQELVLENKKKRIEELAEKAHKFRTDKETAMMIREITAANQDLKNEITRYESLSDGLVIDQKSEAAHSDESDSEKQAISTDDGPEIPTSTIEHAECEKRINIVKNEKKTADKKVAELEKAASISLKRVRNTAVPRPGTPARANTNYIAVAPGIMRKGFGMLSAKVREVDVDEIIVSLETRENVRGQKRIRCSEGWVSETSGTGVVLLNEMLGGGGTDVLPNSQIFTGEQALV